MTTLIEKFKNAGKSVVIGLILLVIFGAVHLYLVSKTFVIDSTGNIHSTTEGYGDIPLHLTQISKFAYAPKFDLSEPIFLGEKIRYPFALNMISGLLLRFTRLLTFSVLFPVYLLIVASIVLIAAIYNKLFKNLLLSSVALWMFMLGSGLGGLKKITYFNAKYPAQNIDFGAPLSLVLIHQRTFFLGLFGFLLFLYLLIRLESSPRATWKLLFGTGLVYGLLPLAHTHSFVAASAVLGIYGLLLLTRKNWAKIKNTAVLLCTGLVLALPQLWYLLSAKSIFSASDSFTRFRLGWMINPTIGSVQFPPGAEPSVFSSAYLHFLSLNFGFILFVLVLGAIYFVFKYKKIEDDKTLPILFLASSAVLFLIVQIIQFQPWDYDNNKLLVYYQFFAAPFTLWLIASLFEQRKKVLAGVIIIYFIAATFTGFIDIRPRLAVAKSDLPEIFNVPAQHLATHIRANMPDELILTSTTHLNPVSSLAGRGVLVGYPGWLWTRGLNYSGRETDLKNFYKDPLLHLGILQKYNVSYVLLDDLARNDYKANQATFDNLFTKVFSEGQYTMYKVKK